MNATLTNVSVYCTASKEPFCSGVDIMSAEALGIMRNTGGGPNSGHFQFLTVFPDNAQL